MTLRADALGRQQNDAGHPGRAHDVDDVLEVAAGHEVGGGEQEDGFRTVEYRLEGFGFGQVDLVPFATPRDGYDVFAGGDQGLDEWAAYVAGCSGDHDHGEDATCR